MMRARMTSRERVLTTFRHEEPDRVPIWVGASAEFWTKARLALGLDDEALRRRLGDDFRRVVGRYAGPPRPLIEGATSCTVFGVQRHGLGYGQPMHHPLAGADLRQIHDYPWPDPAWTDVSGVRADASVWHPDYAVLGGDWSPFWHDAIDLFGMEELMIRMHTAPETVHALMQHLVDYYAEVSHRIFTAAAREIDLFFIGNDLGSQAGPLIGPAAFAEFILPHIRRLVGLGHDYGLTVQMHCCGGFLQLIPMLIAAGLDAIHAVQPSCQGMDLAQSSSPSAVAVCLHGGIDSHHVPTDGTPESVRQSTRESFRDAGGGYVAGASHGILEETPVQNVLAMTDAVQEFGVYR